MEARGRGARLLVKGSCLLAALQESQSKGSLAVTCCVWTREAQALCPRSRNPYALKPRLLPASDITLEGLASLINTQVPVCTNVGP